MKIMHTAFSQEQIQAKLEDGIASRPVFSSGGMGDKGFYGVVKDGRFYIYYKEAAANSLFGVLLSGRIKSTMDGCDVVYTCHKHYLLLSGLFFYIFFICLISYVFGPGSTEFFIMSLAMAVIAVADCLLFLINPKTSVKRLENELRRLVDQ